MNAEIRTPRSPEMRMRKRNSFPIETLRQILDYNPETGQLTWKFRPREFFSTDLCANSWNTRYAHMPAFTAVARGYLIGSVFGVNYGAHRVAWALYYGAWPANHIDHINGIRTDNRIVNLRSVTKLENSQNVKRRIDNKSGVTGVFWCPRGQSWNARITVTRKVINLGYFTQKKDAIEARERGCIKYGFHPNHGRAA